MLNDDPLAQGNDASRGVLRREFLKGSAVAAGAILAGTLAEGNEANAAERTKGPEAGKRKTFLAIGRTWTTPKSAPEAS